MARFIILCVFLSMIGFILLINGTFCAPIENNNEVFELVRQIRRARPQQPNSYPQGSWFGTIVNIFRFKYNAFRFIRNLMRTGTWFSPAYF